MAPSPALLTNEARRRLKAVEDFSELGSGFNIALQDLDIRGAGNMLGAEQSGFIADVGFDTYNQILNEAIRELQSELPDIKIKDNFRQVQSSFVEDCLIDTDLELLLPAGYVSNVSERMYLYRELDQVQSEEKLQEFEKNLVDRFGPVPDTAKELLKIVRLRWAAFRLGFEKIIFKNGKMTGYFISDQKSQYYKSAVFSTILASVQNKPRLFRMKEANNKLTISCEPVRSVQEAIDILNTLATPPASLS
jgi:transcription-repair coupling factor (superfamily II helicase)